MAIIASLLPPTVRWKAFFKSQVKNTSYLQDGDVVEVAVATPDGDLQLGEQRNTVRFSR
jgi:hypothetical protein